MRMTYRLLFSCFLLLTALLADARGQNLQITSQIALGTATQVPNGGSVLLSADSVGRATSATIILRNTGAAAVTLNQISITGASDFTLPGISGFPQTLPAGASFNFPLQYQPSSTNRASAVVQIQTAEGTSSINFTYAFQAIGTVPDYAISYSVGADSTIQTLDSGGRIVFGSANLQSSVVANVTVTNRGSGAGSFQAASTSPYPDFQLSGLPAVPASLNPGEIVRFQILFTPRATGRAAGTLSILLGGNRTFSAALDGIAVAPDFRVSYMLPANQNVLPLSDGGQLAFLATSMGSTSTATVYIENRGTGSGTVNSVSLSGAGFELQGLPPFPLTIDPGKAASFGVRFVPLTAGHYTGTLKVDLKDRTVTVAVDASTAPSDFYLSYSDPRLNNSAPLTDGSQMMFPATSANSTTSMTILVENRGSGAGTLNAVSVGGPGFELASLPLLPLTVQPGKSASFVVNFRPLSSGHYTGTLKVDLKDHSLAIALDGSTAAPDFRASYIDPVLTNSVPVSSGSVIRYPDILTTAKSDILVTFENRGNGAGTISNVTVSGDPAFQLLQLPTLPFTVDAAKNLSFVVRFTPINRQIYAGKLQITLADQTSYTLRLEGTGIGPAFSYALVTTDATTPVLPDGNISFPDSELNQNSTVVLRVSNTGTADGKLTTLLITTGPFSITDAPLPPVSMKPGDSIQLTLAFTPVQTDMANGRLRIGDDTFTLAGKGIGVKWEYSFTKGQATTLLDATNGAVLFGSAPVGEQSNVQFTVVNRGNKAGPIFSLMLSGQTGSSSSAGATLPFQIDGGPALPINLNSGASLTFTIRFQPDNVGTMVANLVVNNVVFPLFGNGLAPQRLPKFSFAGASGTQEPMQQPAIGLTLSEPYPLPLQGTLTLDFVSDVFSGNPAVQFATGGRVARFTIPANGTDAIFDNGAKTVRIQTGTVAGNIVMTPTFATQSGLDLTPVNQSAYTATVSRSAPKLVDIKITNRGLGSFVLSVTGYSTTRSLKQLALDLTPRSDSKLSNTHLTVDLQSASMLWYQSDQSQAFGSLFTISVPVTVQGNGSATEDRVAKLASVSATASNEVGTSNALSIPIP